MSVLQDYKNDSVISELEPFMLRNGNNDLTLSVRHSRNSCIDNTTTSAYIEGNSCRHDLPVVGTQPTQSYDYRVFPGSNKLQSIEDDTESRVLNNSNIFVPEDPSTDLVTEVSLCKNVNNVVDDLFETINNEEGFYQDELAAYAIMTHAVQTYQGQPGPSRENNDLQPSHRHSVSHNLEPRMTKQCTRQTLHQKLLPNFLNNEGSGSMTSNCMVDNAHQISDVPLTNIDRESHDECGVDICSLALPRNQRKSLPLECSLSFVNGRNSMYVSAERSVYSADTNTLTQPRDRRVSLPLEHPSSLTYSLPLEHPSSLTNDTRHSSFCSVEKTVNYNNLVADSNLLAEPRNRRISLPLECPISSTINYRPFIQHSEERVVNRKWPLNMSDSVEVSQNNHDKKSDKCPFSQHEPLFKSICDKRSNRSTSELTRNCSPISDTLDLNNSVTEQTWCIGKENVGLKSKKQCIKSNIQRNRSTRKYATKKTSLYSKQPHSNIRKSRSKIRLNTPGKSRQLQLIHNIHRKIAKSSELETSELRKDTDSGSMLSKLEDIFPLASVIQKPTRPLRTRAVKDIQTLSRELSSEGIWTSVNSNLLS